MTSEIINEEGENLAELLCYTVCIYSNSQLFVYGGFNFILNFS
jgi:hypothetical protein